MKSEFKKQLVYWIEYYPRSIKKYLSFPLGSPNAQLQNNQGQSGSSDSRSSTPPKSMKKRAAPKPPAINQVKSTNSSRDSSPSNNSTVSFANTKII